MRKIGGYMVFFGLFAIVLNVIDRVPTILIWIYSWGDSVAWAIKIGLVVMGAVLFFMGKPDTAEEKSTDAESKPEV
jgi:hypothetical protein